MAHTRLRYNRCCRCGDRFLATSMSDLTCPKCSKPATLVPKPVDFQEERDPEEYTSKQPDVLAGVERIIGRHHRG
jgi:hypothetical protein